MDSRRRSLATFAFVVVSGFVVLDAAPRWGVARTLAERIDPVMDVTGLWQGPWTLFAPDVDKVNMRVSAQVVFLTGVKTVWRSPDWERMSAWERFESFRYQEYVDNIRSDDNAGAWIPLARHLARMLPSRTTGPVVKVTLTRLWAEIPPPEERFLPARPYTEFTEKYEFLVWRPGKRSGGSR
jgi:hypothetical protein